MSQKGLAPILIVLLIALGIGGYLVYSGKIHLNQKTSAPQQTTQSSPTSSPPYETANWKIYTNSKYGYSFKYPSNLTLDIETEGSNPTKNFLTTNHIEVYQNPIGTKDNKKVYWVNVVNGKETLDAYKKNLTPNRNKNIAIITVDGVNALSYEVSDPDYPQDQPDKLIAIIKNNQRYDIFLGMKGDTSIGEQILSTFKFQ